MIAINTKVWGFRGAKQAQLVKLPKDKRVFAGGKRMNYRYGILVVIHGQELLYPANKNGTVKMADKHHCVKPIRL